MATRKLAPFVALLGLLLAFPVGGGADVVELKTGRRVEGTLKQATPASVSIEVGGQTITFTGDKVRAIYFGAAPTPAAPPNEDALSPEFKEKAQRALDAVERVPHTLSKRDMTLVNQNLLVDADKAVAEAKYKATTALDMRVLRTLQTWVIYLKHQAIYNVLDAKWQPRVERTFQCQLEARLHIGATLSEQGRERAKLDTCYEKP